MISLILMIIAGALNACMDKVSFHFNSSIFFNMGNSQWYAPSMSWRNKWKNGDQAQGEKFWLSSSLLVAFTDFWHMCKQLMIISLCVALVLANTNLFGWESGGWYFLLAVISFQGSFQLFFGYILKAKK